MSCGCNDTILNTPLLSGYLAGDPAQTPQTYDVDANVEEGVVGLSVTKVTTTPSANSTKYTFTLSNKNVGEWTPITPAAGALAAQSVGSARLHSRIERVTVGSQTNSTATVNGSIIRLRGEYGTNDDLNLNTKYTLGTLAAAHWPTEIVRFMAVTVAVDLASSNLGEGMAAIEIGTDGVIKLTPLAVDINTLFSPDAITVHLNTTFPTDTDPVF